MGSSPYLTAGSELFFSDEYEKAIAKTPGSQHCIINHLTLAGWMAVEMLNQVIKYISKSELKVRIRWKRNDERFLVKSHVELSLPCVIKPF